MKRKVNRVGINTLTVSLPSKWAKKHEIRAGEEVEVDEDGATLIVSKNANAVRREAILHLAKESERYIRSQIGRLYRQGYSIITISFDHPDVIAKVKHAINNLIGADIIDIETHKCIVKIFPFEGEEVDFDNNMTKMLLTIKYMFATVREDTEKNSFTNDSAIDELRFSNWKIRDFILRYALLQNEDFKTFSNLCHITFCYEKIGTKLSGFYRRYLVAQKGIDGRKKILSSLDTIKVFIEKLIKVLSEKEPLTPSAETKYRHELLEFNTYLLHELHSDKNIDHPFLTLIYFTAEMLDSTVSYIQAYKQK